MTTRGVAKEREVFDQEVACHTAGLGEAIYAFGDQLGSGRQQ